MYKFFLRLFSQCEHRKLTICEGKVYPTVYTKLRLTVIWLRGLS